MERKRDSLGLVPIPEPGGIPAWFVDELHAGICNLCVLTLRDRPRGNPDPALNEQLRTAEVWAAGIWPGRRWEEATDRGRIKLAFNLLIGGHRLRGDMDSAQFPNPADFLDALPRRQNETRPAPANSVGKAEAKIIMQRIQAGIKAMP